MLFAMFIVNQCLSHIKLPSNHNLKSDDYFILSRNYSLSSSYYVGIEHTCPHMVEVYTTVYSSSCVFWSKLSKEWESSGCQPTADTNRDQVVCQCNHLSTFSSNIKLMPNLLDFSVLKVYS